MTTQEAIPAFYRLNRKWGVFTGSPTEVLSQVSTAINRELEASRSGRIQISAALATEMRAELILCGKIKAAFGRKA